MTRSRPNRLSEAASRSTRRLDERAAGEAARRVRVSCDLTEANYRLLHAAVADYRATKIDILNALVALLDEPEIAARVARDLGRDAAHRLHPDQPGLSKSGRAPGAR